MTGRRAFALLAALALLAGVAVWNEAWSTDHATPTPRARTAVADPDTRLVVPGVGEVKSQSPLGVPLATMAVGLAVALLAPVRRDRRALRAAYPIRRRLVRASRRAPPAALLPVFA
jgi:hypothetical protein